MSTQVELIDITRRYGEFYALKNFNLTIRPGEFVTLLGPSGSGKSSALRLLAGFDEPTSGDIRLGNRSILGVPSHERNIGMVFQNYALFPHMTAYDNVAFPLRIRDIGHEEVKTRVADVLRMTRLEQFAKRYPRELSGGQQQRVALARAVVFSPQLLLMDEPLGALDRHLREQLKFEIRRIHDTLGMTVLFVTHDQDEALVMSDRVVVMQDGQLVQSASPAEIYARPANRFVAAFMGESNILSCRADGGRLVHAHGVLPGEAGSSDRTAWMLVRPETIRMASSADDNHTIPARVIETIFLGESTRYILEALGERIVAKQQNAGSAPYALQAPVYIGWDPATAVLLDM